MFCIIVIARCSIEKLAVDDIQGVNSQNGTTIVNEHHLLVGGVFSEYTHGFRHVTQLQPADTAALQDCRQRRLGLGLRYSNDNPFHKQFFAAALHSALVAHAAPDARARAPYGGAGLRADSKANASAVRGAVGEAYAPPVAAADAAAFARADAAADATPVAGAEPLSDHAGAVTSADDVASSDDVASTISSTDDAGALRCADARTDACADSWAYA